METKDDTTGEASEFERALLQWRDIGLSDLQRQLDAQADQISVNQRDSLVERKELAVKTKEFKKLKDDEKLSQVKSLIKAYQTEIDALTNRSKLAENAFLNVYRLLGDAPDPYPLLEATVSQLLTSIEMYRVEEENKRLREQVAQCAEIEPLKEKLKKAQVQAEEAARNREQARERELTALWEEREKNWAARESELLSQVNEARTAIKELKVSQDFAQARLNEQDGRIGESVESSLAELEIITSDLERSRRRIAETQSRNEELTREVAILRNGEDEAKLKNLGAQVDDLEEQLSAAKKRYDRTVSAAEQANDGSTKRIGQLEKELERRQSDIDMLRERLQPMADYDELKREVDILKQIELSTGYEENESIDSNALEKQLARRNRKLVNDMAVMRVAHAETESQYAKLKAELESVLRELTEAQQLNAKLEEDLSNIRPKSEPASEESDLQRSVVHGEATLLTIVMQQRDRLQNKCNELEDEICKGSELKSELKTEVEGLRKDNIELFEKLRYVQHYRSGKSGVDIEKGAIGVKYRQAYDASLSPFEIFRGQETQRVYSRMNPFERAVLSLFKLAFANKLSRNIFAAYALGLHLIVILSLYKLGTTEVAMQPGLDRSNEWVTQKAGQAIGGA